MIDDIRRKDFIAIHDVDMDLILSKKLKSTMMKRFAEATPYMRFLCNALELPFD